MEDKNQNSKRIWIPQLIACGMLLWALNPGNSYGYYILLRWICCGIFAYLAVQASKQEKEEWTWILGITAAIYNPIFRVSLNRELWSAVNIVTIGIAAVSIFVVNRREYDKMENHERRD